MSIGIHFICMGSIIFLGEISYITKVIAAVLVSLVTMGLAYMEKLDSGLKKMTLRRATDATLFRNWCSV